MIWGVWCLSLVVLVNVYTGTLTSLLSAPSFSFYANSLQDVANNQLTMPLTLRKGPVEEYIRVKFPIER